MELNEIINLLSGIINGNCSPYLSESIEPYEFAEQVFAKTAEDQKKYIGTQRIRETSTQLDQRIRLTNPITAAAISPALAYVEELQRTDGVNRQSSFTDTETFAKVQESLSNYYAGQTVTDFIFQSVKLANEQDPNSWLVFERSLNSDGNYIFYPVLVESEQAVNWMFNKNGDLEYFCFSESDYVRQTFEGGANVQQVNNFYLYGVGFAAYAQYMGEGVEPKYEDEYFSHPDSPDYAVWVFNTGTTETPAIRLGAYLTSLDINEPCELIYESARGHLKDLMRLKSSHDLNEVLHMYPKLFQYVKACSATEPDTGIECRGGYYGGDYLRKCNVCGGTGKVVHGGEQDVVTLAFPETKEEFVDLAQIAHYMTLPLEVFLNQQQQIERLSTILTYVIYSQEQTEAMGIKTATEININYSRIYNKLYPIAQKWAQCESKAYRVAMQYYGAYKIGENFNVTFPMDFAMKTEKELLSDLADAKTSNAPYAVQKSISDTLLKKKHKDDRNYVSDMLAFDALKPFSDKSPEELAMILATRAKTDPKRVAWENWQEIQTNIQARLKDRGTAFYLYPMEVQRKEVADEVAAIIAEMPVETNSFNQLPVFQ